MLGVDLDALPDQFGGYVQGRTLIIDGDGPAYVAAATVKKLDTGIRRFQQAMLERMFVTNSQSIRIHLTSRDSTKLGRFRVKAAKPYQGQRKSGNKPPLLEPLREAMADRTTWLEQFEFVRMHRDMEADDAMMMDAFELGEHGVISSEDKDLRITPFLYHEMKTNQVMTSQPAGWVDVAYTPSGTPKLHGQGPMFFWLQMLAGDAADNIQGIRRLNGQLCGVIGAVEAIKPFKSIPDAANFVVDSYRNIDQNVLAEAWLLWFPRRLGDNALTYLNECGLSADNLAFVDNCARRDWVEPVGVTTEEFDDAPF